MAGSSTLAERFELGALIGEGGSARVFRAVDRLGGEVVAVKMLHEFLARDVTAAARFASEAEMLGRFDHPNILPLLARGESPRPWIATAYAAGGSLADRMVRRGPLASVGLLAHVAEVLDALHYLHGRGVVHRDVKPDNILIDADDVAVLTDFGVALWPANRPTVVGDQMGTPSFMPPEQFVDPRNVTVRSDLFGVGITLFVGCTGHTGMLLLVEHLRRDALSRLPADIARIVDRSTRLEATERYASAREMSLDLADAIDRR